VPAAGGRVGSLTVEGTELLVTGDPADTGTMWGSFPMVPWAGRLRDARFTHDGVTYQLERTLPPHAIHGVAFAQPWLVDSVGRTNATLTRPLDWPLGGHATQGIELSRDALRCTLRVTAGGRSMPAELGWHPWLAATGGVTVRAGAMYERGADGLPTGRLVDPAPPPWDDCFRTSSPVTVPVAPYVVTIASDCDHVVVFDALDHGVAVEPQSGPPDAFHLRRRVLAAGASLERSMTLTWHRPLPTGW